MPEKDEREEDGVSDGHIELIERVMTEHWDMVACHCAFCLKARELGCRPRFCYPNMPNVSIFEGSDNPVARMVGQVPREYDWTLK